MGLQYALTAHVQCSLISQTVPEMHDKKPILKALVLTTDCADCLPRLPTVILYGAVSAYKQ